MFLDSFLTQNISLSLNLNLSAKQAASELLGSPSITPPLAGSCGYTQLLCGSQDLNPDL